MNNSQQPLDSSVKSEFLVFDYSVSGHHSDYFNALYQFLRARSHVTVTFMIAPEMLERVPVVTCPNIRYRMLTAAELETIHSKGLFRRTHYIMQLALREIAKNKQREVVLLQIDHFAIILTLYSVFRELPAISGLLFVPYARLQKVAREKKLGFRARTTIWRKRLVTTAMMMNRSIRHIYVVGDEYAAESMNRQRLSDGRFRFLPEPYMTEPRCDHPVDIRDSYGLDADCKIVLIFGSILRRKNVENVIASLSYMSEDLLRNSALLILGHASEDYRVKIQEMISNTCEGHSSKKIIFDCKFHETNVLDSAVAQCDVIAMPYRESYQSSGVFFIAARFGKPAIVPDAGLMNDMAEQYKIGIGVDVESPQDIGKAIETILSGQYVQPTVDKIAEIHTPVKFAETVFQCQSPR